MNENSIITKNNNGEASLWNDHLDLSEPVATVIAMEGTS